MQGWVLKETRDLKSSGLIHRNQNAEGIAEGIQFGEISEDFQELCFGEVAQGVLQVAVKVIIDQIIGVIGLIRVAELAGVLCHLVSKLCRRKHDKQFFAALCGGKLHLEGGSNTYSENLHFGKTKALAAEAVFKLGVQVGQQPISYRGRRSREGEPRGQLSKEAEQDFSRLEIQIREVLVKGSPERRAVQADIAHQGTKLVTLDDKLDMQIGVRRIIPKDRNRHVANLNHLRSFLQDRMLVVASELLLKIELVLGSRQDIALDGAGNVGGGRLINRVRAHQPAVQLLEHCRVNRGAKKICVVYVLGDTEDSCAVHIHCMNTPFQKFVPN